MSLFSADEKTTIFDSPTFEKDIRIHVDEDIGSASIAPSGRDVVLASRHGLHIIDLDSPFSPPRHIRHETPWSPADVQWSPFASRYYWVASTSNQRALIWNLEAAQPIEHVLHGHYRAITDINFSAHHPDVLATCAVDSFVHCWDLRTPASPAMSFSDWYAGATQVKWNRQDSHILASSHDRFLRIWDDRKGATPLTTIDAHATKIYGIDWHRTDASRLITCSLDRTIKIWDYTASDVHPERIIRTHYPVWRARHTPFGCGLLAMPQRGDARLHLYDRRIDDDVPWDAHVEPAYSFKGHHGQVKEFLWRARGNLDNNIDNRDFQLVTWGADRELILHRMQSKQYKPVGFEKGMQLEEKWSLTRRGSPYTSFRDVEQPKAVLVPPPTQQHTETNWEATQAVLEGRGSPGMTRAPIPATRDWINTGSVMTSSNIQAQNAYKRDNAPIMWMKGVKFGKKNGPSKPKSRSSLPGDPKTNAFRRQGERLQEEVIHASDRFRKVTFEEIDISERYAKISLNGPWAADGKQSFMQIDLRFPTDYPEQACPRFHIVKASSIPEDRLEMLDLDLQKIAEAHVEHQLGCLEAILSYLLGEQDLKETIRWLSGEDSDGSLERADSSSDEEDNLGDFSTSQSQTLDGESILQTSVLGSNANVPLPKACGALWAPNGRLVCFFPPKAQQPSLLDRVGLAEKNARADGLFEGFGRINMSSPEPKGATSDRDEESAENSGSDESSDSSSSSSSDSGTAGAFLDRYAPPKAWHQATLRLAKLKTHSSVGSLNGSHVFSKGSTAMIKQKNVVTLHNVDDLLPVKQSLAKDYLVYGESQTVCQNNADVASKNSFAGIADVWKLLGVILSDEVPLRKLERKDSESVLVMAQRQLKEIKRKHPGMALSFDEPQEVINPLFRGHTKWGNHPLGKSWLIRCLFESFEKTADVQMLAMMSCVLANAGVHAPYQTQPALGRFSGLDSMRLPGESLPYLASEEVARSLKGPLLSVHISPVHSRASNSAYGSYSSMEGFREIRSPPPSEPTTPFSLASTPPLSLSRSSSHRVAAVQSMSASPDNKVPGPNSATSSFSASVWSRPFQLSSSPPQRKRISGEENLASSVASNPSGSLTWAASTMHGSNATIRRSYLAQELADASDGSTTDEDEVSTPPDQSVRVSFKNQSLFDDEGGLDVPLLNPDHERRGIYAAYRDSYATMLEIWGLDVAAHEIRKFNAGYLATRGEPVFNDAASQNTLTVTKLDARPQQQESEQGLQLVRTCSRCKTSAPVGGENRCGKCGVGLRLIACSICEEPVTGLYKSCIACGHAAHLECLRSWLEADSDGHKDDTLEAGCSEAGCDCRCAEHACMAVGN